ncbi:MAG: hypothetical protein ACNI3A_07755 [Desulfovibrio sp.]|uniref:hypothetical protein n=1 Tax=Desulfovibrio sp. 7SRBS1 TaxID=3378064 RepID=UPI003B3F51FE
MIANNVVSSSYSASMSSTPARQKADPNSFPAIDTSELDELAERLAPVVIPAKLVVEKVDSVSLPSRADEAMAGVMSQFKDLFLSKFGSDGSWVEKGISSEKYDGFVSSLEQHLKNGNYDSARSVVQNFLSDVSEVARKHLLDIGAQSGRTLHNELFDQFSYLVFADFEGQSMEIKNFSKFREQNLGGQDSLNQGFATQLGATKSAFSKEKNALAVNGGQKLPNEKAPDKEDPDKEVEGAGDIVEDAIKATQQVYYSRLNSLYGREEGAPGMQQVVEAAMDRLDTYFRNAYRNNYTEDAESTLGKSAEALAGALFGRSAISALDSTSVTSANGQAAGVENSVAQDDVGLSAVGRVFSRAAHSNNGSSDLLFKNLKDVFMDKLEQALDGRSLGKEVAVYDDPPLYSDKGVEVARQHGAAWEQIV